MYETETTPAVGKVPAPIFPVRAGGVVGQELRPADREPPTYSQLVSEDHKLAAYAQELGNRLEGLVLRLTGHSMPRAEAPGNGRDPGEPELLEQHRRANQALGQQLNWIQHSIEVLAARI